MDFDSLVMTFFGIPILAQFLAAVVPCWGPGLPLFLRFAIYSLRNNLSSTQRLYADAGGDNHIFSGRVWAGDSAPEKREIAAWHNAFFSYPRY